MIAPPPAPPEALAGAAPDLRAVWAGPGALRALAAGGRGLVELALRPGGYVRLGDEWVLVAIARAPRGPLSLLVGGLARHPLRPGTPAVAEAGVLTIGELRIGFEPAPADPDDLATRPPADPDDLATRPPGVPDDHAAPAAIGSGRPAALVAAPAHAAPFPATLAALAAALAAAPPPPPELSPGLAALRAGALDGAVARLAGRGDGLTPAGDDVLAGFAAWGAVPGLAALAARRSSPLGLAYLRCAERGELPEPVARVLDAIRAGDPALARLRARGLARWGASSGAAMLWGIAAAATGACA
jgi:hypothetical protein